MLSNTGEASPMVHVNEEEYFVADDRLAGICIYGQCIQSGVDRLVARCYSKLCPDGESGYYPVVSIVRILSADEFEQARRDGWPL